MKIIIQYNIILRIYSEYSTKHATALRSNKTYTTFLAILDISVVEKEMKYTTLWFTLI